MNFKKILLYCYIVILLMGSFVFFGESAFATDTVVESYTACKPECCSSESPNDCGNDCAKYCGNYENLDSMLSLVVKVMNIILGLVGSLALLAFVYGGILFLTSAGSKEQVEKGRKAIIGAVVGLIIVFTSYTIIGFVFTSFGGEEAKGWNKINWF